MMHSPHEERKVERDVGCNQCLLRLLFVCYGVHHLAKVLEYKDINGKKEKKSWVILLLQLARVG